MENITLSKATNQKAKEEKKPEDHKSPGLINTDINMLVSGMIQKDGKSFARVSFVRGRCWAEGVAPDGVIEKSEGFDQQELAQLAAYLTQEKDMILAQAKGVNPLKNMLGI